MKKFEWKDTIYYTILRLKFLGLWPDGEAYKFNLYSVWSIVSISLFTMGHNFFQSVNLIFIFNDLQAILATIFVTLSELLVIQKTYCIVKNMKVLKQLMITLSSELFQPKNDRQMELVQPALVFWKINSFMYWTMASGAVFFWSTYPIFDNSVKDYKLPFLAWYPYNTKISPNYEITYIYQALGVAFVASTALSVDTLMAAFNMYIGAQFDILCDDVRHLFDDNDNVNQKLIKCIEHHKEILKFAEMSDKFSNWIVMGQFFVSATSIGITMFQLTTVKPFSSECFSLLAFLSSIIVEIFMYCWFGNEVEIKSSQIAYAVFESDWIKGSEKVKKHLIFFVTRCQKPLKMSALELFYLSLETFMKILRASWSYFALLHQLSSRK